MTVDEILRKHGAVPDGLAWSIKDPGDRARFLSAIALLGASFVPNMGGDNTPVLWPYWETPSGTRVAAYDPDKGSVRLKIIENGFKELLG